jgi:hypothetical protein
MSQLRAPAVAGLGLLLANTTIEPLPLTPYRPWLHLPDEWRHQVFEKTFRTQLDLLLGKSHLSRN